MGSKIDLPKEIANLNDLAVDGMTRHENSILHNVPDTLAEKGTIAVTLFLYFMDNETINPWTGKPTHLNIEESYIASGVYGVEHLEKVYDVTNEEVEVRRRDGTSVIEYQTVYTVLDRAENMRIRAEALRYWTNNNLNNHFREMQEIKRGNIEFTELLKVAIENDALKPGDTVNRRMAIDIHGMKNKHANRSINIYLDGGGDKHNREIISSTGNDNYDLGLTLEADVIDE